MKRPEETLHRAVATYLAVALPSRALWWSTANQRGTRSRWEMGLLKALGVRPGIPDILVYFDGLLIGIELKAAKGRISEAQAVVSDLIVDNGGLWRCCRSVEDVEAALRNAGVPLKARAA